MTSKKRSEASRRNGARSRGPVTAAGKARSSQNAMRHDLLAKRTVLANEDPENFQMVLDQYVEKFAPRDGVEFGMIEEMVSCYWRLHRCLAIERALLDEALLNHPESDQPLRTAQAWNDLGDTNRLQTMLRYQAMLHRMHQSAFKNLLILRKIEPEDAELPNEPESVVENGQIARPLPANTSEIPENIEKSAPPAAPPSVIYLGTPPKPPKSPQN